MRTRFLILVTMTAFLVTSPRTVAENEVAAPKDKPIILFDGKTVGDLSQFETKLRDKNKDTANVYKITDGIIQVTGDGFGGLVTKGAFKDYHLVFEFKWGPRVWGGRKKMGKDSGIMFHVTGPHDAFGGWLPEAFQCQLQHGGTGDFYVVKAKGPTKLSATAEVETRGKKRHWKEGGEKVTLARGPVFSPYRAPDWKNELGFRGPNDPDSPDGEWTRVDVICDGDKATILVNGRTTAKVSALQPAAGKIWIQCEGAEYFIRKFVLYPIGKAPTP